MEPIIHNDARIARADTMEDSKAIQKKDMIEKTKDDMLYAGVMAEVERGRVCLAHGRRSWAINHLEEAWSLYKDYQGNSELKKACQNLEDEVNRPHSADAPQTPKRQRASSQPLEPGSARSVQSIRRDSDTSLYKSLWAELGGLSPKKEDREDRQHRSRPRVLDPRGNRLRAELARFASGSFEGIDEMLERLRKEQAVRNSTPERAALAASNARTVEKVHHWQAHALPESPSSFKNSEEPSPRRHSFPVASPPISPSTPTTHSRKRSIHVLSQHAEGLERCPASPAAKSDKYTESDYSRRRSHDETSTILSDTPALAKLVDQVHTNPFMDSDHSIAGKIRRLSADGSGIKPLSVSTTTHERAEPTAPSPLRESFVADELPAAGNNNSSDATDQSLTSNITGPSKLLRSTKLRQELGLKRTFSSRLPKPVRSRHTQQTGATGMVEPPIAGPADSNAEAAKSSLTFSTNVVPDLAAEKSGTILAGSSTYPTYISGGILHESPASISSGSNTTVGSNETVIHAPSPFSETAIETSTIKTPLSNASVWGSSSSTTAATGRNTPSSEASSPLSTPTKVVLRPQPLFTKANPSVASSSASNQGTNTPPSSRAPVPSTPLQRASLATHTSSSSISSLASKFESPKSTHETPLRSSTNTQRAFSAGLAAFNSPSSSTISSKPSLRSLPQAASRPGTAGTGSGRNAAVEPRDKPVGGNNGGGLQRTSSVSQRVLALDARPPWQIPGKSAAVVASSTTAKVKPGSAAGAAGSDTSVNKSKTWKGRHGPSTSEGSTFASGSCASARSESNATPSPSSAAFVRHGAEMARGAGVRRE